MTGAAGVIYNNGTGASLPPPGTPGGAFTVTPNPQSVSGAYRGTSPAAQNISTGATVLAVTGGASPYTYVWALYGTAANTWTIGAATSSSTAFTAQAVGPGTSAYATFSVTVTDALGAKSIAYVDATANNLSSA